jgi:hypothetical protein
MSLSSLFNLSTHRRLALNLALLLPTAVSIAPSVTLQALPVIGGQIDKTCRGLYAGIRAEFVKRDPSNNQKYGSPFLCCPSSD